MSRKLLQVQTDSRSVCPTGWHLPNNAEWATLKDYLTINGYGYEGSGNEVAKSMAATFGWTIDPTPGNIGNDQASNNSSGFTALPGGSRIIDGSFGTLGEVGTWWSSTEQSISYAYTAYLINHLSYLSNDYTIKIDGGSVRCLKDN
jgi:uncharacterized protein (TIGR02145 family)